MPPLRRSTSDHRCSGFSVKASSFSASSMIQSSRPSSFSSWPALPARVAGEHAPPRRRRHDLFRVVERREAERAEERHRRVVRIDELAEHEHRIRLHRPAEPDLLLVLDERLELRHELRHRRRRRPVEHETCRAFVRVLGDEHDGAAEVRVEQRRRRDQQLALERVHGTLLCPLRGQCHQEAAVVVVGREEVGVHRLRAAGARLELERLVQPPHAPLERELRRDSSPPRSRRARDPRRRRRRSGRPRSSRSARRRRGRPRGCVLPGRRRRSPRRGPGSSRPSARRGTRSRSGGRDGLVVEPFLAVDVDRPLLAVRADEVRAPVQASCGGGRRRAPPRPGAADAAASGWCSTRTSWKRSSSPGGSAEHGVLQERKGDDVAAPKSPKR